MSNHGSLVTLLKFQMASKLRLLISSGSKKEEPRYTCLSEAKSRIHKEFRKKRFPLSLHTSYIMDCLAALVGEDVSSECYVL